jgi:hypothetical protein
MMVIPPVPASSPVIVIVAVTVIKATGQGRQRKHRHNKPVQYIPFHSYAPFIHLIFEWPSIYGKTLSITILSIRSLGLFKPAYSLFTTW